MPKNNVISFYRIKEEMDILVETVADIEEYIGNNISEEMQEQLQLMVDGYNKLFALDRQLILEWDFCSDLEKETLELFFDAEPTSQ